MYSSVSQNQPTHQTQNQTQNQIQQKETRGWTNMSLKTQLQTYFFILVFTSLLLTGIACIVFQVVSSQKVNTSVYNGFKSQSESDMIMIITDGAKLFDQKLFKLTSNFPKVMTITIGDLYRPDNPFGYIPSHYNWPGQLIDQRYDANYNANITYVHSTINVYDHTIYELSGLSQSLKETINVTAAMDYTFVPTFSNSEDFFAGYFATPSQFLRYYPGAINYNNVNKYIMYNNIGDYWYETVMDNTNDVTYTSPYYDPLVKKLMITIGKVAKTSTDGTILGAFGSDLILTSIQNDIKNFKYLGEGRTILFEKATGYVIADSNVDMKSLNTYSNVTNPSINTDTWNSLVTKEKTLIKQDNYYFVSSDLETSNGQYMLVSLIDESYVFNTYDSITSEINSMTKENIGIVAGVFAGVTLIVMVLTYFLTDRIASPLQRLTQISSQITGKIGEENLMENVDTNIRPSGISEIDNVTTQFQRAIEMVNTSRVVNDTVQNDYYNNAGHIPWIDQTTVVPSAPAYVVAYPVTEIGSSCTFGSGNRIDMDMVMTKEGHK